MKSFIVEAALVALAVVIVAGLILSDNSVKASLANVWQSEVERQKDYP